MDHTTDVIVTFVDGLALPMIPARTLHEAKRRLVDSLGCAIGAIDSRPAAIARDLASDVTSALPATAIGLPRPTSTEMAAFTNTVMLRYLDYNDTYFSPRGGGGHPSDLIPTSLAVGQAVGASGADVLLSVVLAYEVVGALAGTVRIRERGWDQGLFTVVASAMAAGKLLHLSRSQLAHTVSLAITPHVPTRRTRAGELSMWKGCATAATARNGVFAAALAERGMTGPPSPFEGAHGIWEQVTGPFQLDLTIPQPGAFVVERTHLKSRPAEYNSQGPLDLILAMRGEIEVENIERIDVETYWLTYSEIGSEPAKWDPQTRETADHSLPYLLAVALVDGEVGLRSFVRERILDPTLRPLMKRIFVTERAEFTQRFPAEIKCRISIRLLTGQSIERETSYPRGHARNPLSDEDVDRKFDSLVDGRGEADAQVCNEIRRTLWTLDRVPNVATVLDRLGQLRTSPPGADVRA
ncbi:MAG TPA: MmgE/PrpD family protein [bacterium]|nr:MmgE/PrpD family protein [bacterium]